MSISFNILSYNQCDNIIKILNSIRYANIKDYEVVIIDNNSTDFIFEKVKKYCEYYKINYKFVNNPFQKNQSYSRNLGIENSTKEYIYFIDGDDYLNSYSLSQIKLKDDVVFVPRIAKSLQDKYYKININNIENKKFYSSPVGAFYKKDFLKKYNIWHEETKFYYYSEDLIFTALLFDVILNNDVKYNYIEENPLYFGIKRSSSTKVNKDLIKYYINMRDYILEHIKTIHVAQFIFHKIGELIEECSLNGNNK